MYGFIESNMTDHALAAYIRKRGLIDSFHHVGASTQYFDAAGVVHVVVVFDNAATTRKVYVKES